MGIFLAKDILSEWKREEYADVCTRQNEKEGVKIKYSGQEIFCSWRKSVWVCVCLD